MNQPAQLTVSTSPHWLGRTTIRSMHIEWLIALAPALLTGFYYFGGPAAEVMLCSVIGALAAEAAGLCLLKKPMSRLADLHALLIGVLMGAVLPSGAPLPLALVGGALAVTLGKTLFGGLGGYPLNPVLVAWAALMISWPEQMNAFMGPLPLGGEGGEWEQAATPLMELKEDIGTLEIYDELGSLWAGNTAGAIGATGAWALMVGGVYLCLRRLIPWQIPFGVLLGAAAMTLLATYTDERTLELGFEEFSQNWHVVKFHFGAGGMMLATFFLAPEPVSSPTTPWGTFLFGLGVGIWSIIIRTWGVPVEGVYYGVLFMNLLTPILDRIRPKVLGKVTSL